MVTRRDILKKLVLSFGGLFISKTTFAASVPKKSSNTSAHIFKQDRISQSAFYQRCTFENFIAGDNNRLALEASLITADLPINKYNPLFIYGDDGIGKTHLMLAIWNKVLGERNDIVVRFASLEQFSHDLVSAIRLESMSDFREYYSSADILLLDDFQFIKGKQHSQIELLHLIDSFLQQNRQIVITSDALPKYMMDMLRGLRSRLSMGHPVDIQRYSLDTKILIAKKKIESRDAIFAADVHKLIAVRAKNIRELEGLIIKADAYASLTGEPIDIDLVNRLIGS